MRTDHYYNSCGEGKIHYIRWTPEGTPKAVVQILHGIAEYAQRYADFADYLNDLGYLVVAEDHMGHGKSISKDTTQGYFAGGWFAAVDDSHKLMEIIKEEYPDIPYVVFGHSMGSFMTRTWLSKYPQDDIAGAVICGTGWMSPVVLNAGKLMAETICRKKGERTADEKLQGLAFSGYNNRVEHPRTSFDWLSRDNHCVDAYAADPLCGFTATAGLLRDMFGGMLHIQKQNTLSVMNRKTPVFFIAGGDDPVGGYGKGVKKTAQAFKNVGMEQVDLRIYPLCRHEILNELNRREIWEDVAQWVEKVIAK